MGGRMIFNAFFAALGQMGDRRFQGVLWLGVGVTIAMLIGAYWLLAALISGWIGAGLTLPFIGEADWLVSAGSLLVVLVASIFLMVPVASAVSGLFLDRVAQAVEDRHYSHLGPAREVTLAEAIKDTINFLGILLLANVCALILYLIFAPIAPLIFWALNGFLLGREYFMVAAIRRLPRLKAKELRARNMGTIWAAGVLMVIPLTIPVVNLIVPVLGAATFTHVFHNLIARR
jgi:uncharacterized protein involved in cysteine biosynthesis